MNWPKAIILIFSVIVFINADEILKVNRTIDNNGFIMKISSGNNLLNTSNTYVHSDSLDKMRNKLNDTEYNKILTQREVARPPKKQEEDNKDVRLFLPPDISTVLNAMSNLQDQMCKQHILLTIHALDNKEMWAMKMLDSSAKFPSGILIGSYYQLGNYDECIGIRYSEGDLDVPQIKGQYCLAEVTPKNSKSDGSLGFQSSTKKISRNEENSTLRWAICVPHSCKPREVAIILDFILNGAIGTSDAVSVNVSQNMCHYDHEIPYTTPEIIYGYMIIVFASVICIATFTHVVLHYRKKVDKMSSGLLLDVVLAFSVITNVHKLLKVGKSDLNLNCICGIKLLSMVLIVSAHSLLFLVSGPITNNDFFSKSLYKVENGIYLNNPLLVDTYLLISGFLMCRLVLLELDKRKGKINFFLLYIFRYIRLTPSYLVVIGLYCTWLIRLDQGPLWETTIGSERDRCINSWWSNLLYINNYVNDEQLCMFQSWYLAVDTQLFILAPIVVYPLWRWRRCGEILLGISLLVTVLIPSIITYTQNLDPTLMMYIPEIRKLFKNNYFINTYIKTHMRANSYCIGLFMGYVLHKIQASNYKFPKISIALGWAFSALFMMASIFSVRIFYKEDYEYNNLDAAFYSVLHRVVWCLGIGWVIVACATGNGGPVQSFLCWKPFIPLSRLTYSAYLINGVVELHGFSVIRQPRFLSSYHLSVEALAHMFFTFTYAFFLCIVFESPIHSIEKILLNREKKHNQNREVDGAILS